MIKYVKTGNKIIIAPLHKTEDPEREGRLDDEGLSYVSQVEEVREPREITASVPISRGKLTRLPQSARYNFIIHTERGMISFIGRVESYFQEDNIYLMKVKFNTLGELMQRREFYRFPCVLPIKFATAKDDNDKFDDNDDSNMFKGLTLDISGGGLQFVSDEAVDKGLKIRCILDLGTDLLIIISKILERFPPKDGGYKFQYRIVFAGITQNDQDRIIKYIFNEQRQQLKVIR